MYRTFVLPCEGLALLETLCTFRPQSTFLLKIKCRCHHQRQDQASLPIFLPLSLTPCLSSGRFPRPGGTPYIPVYIHIPSVSPSLKSNGLQLNGAPHFSVLLPSINQATTPLSPPLHTLTPHRLVSCQGSGCGYWNPKKGSTMPPSFANLRMSLCGILSHTTATFSTVSFYKQSDNGGPNSYNCYEGVEGRSCFNFT